MDALWMSILAGIIGVALIFVLMLTMYRIMGIAANVALLLYILIVFWIFVGMGGVLTLPGIAGIILSIGMAVDGNVIIFSRVREEIKNGKTIRVSAVSGFKRALGTIIDSHITTIIAGIVLYQLGTGSVKGFALDADDRYSDQSVYRRRRNTGLCGRDRGIQDVQQKQILRDKGGEWQCLILNVSFPS